MIVLIRQEGVVSAYGYCWRRLCPLARVSVYQRVKGVAALTVERTLLVASTGGHLSQMAIFADALTARDRRHWATFSNPQSLSLLKNEAVTFFPYVRPRGLVPILASIPKFLRLLRSERITTVISTGSGFALGAFVAARLLRIRAVYIESVSRVRGPSLTGRIVSLLHLAELRSQHADTWRGRRWAPQESVFGSYRAVERPVSRAEGLRIFVTLGTIRPYRFDALVAGVLSTGLVGAHSVWQTGATTGWELPGAAHPMLSQDEFVRAVRGADVVVSHAGVGTLIQLLELGVYPVVVPRRRSRGEHVDDHQEEIAQLCAQMGVAEVVEAELITGESLTRASRRRVERAQP